MCSQLGTDFSNKNIACLNRQGGNRLPVRCSGEFETEAKVANKTTVPCLHKIKIYETICSSLITGHRVYTFNNEERASPCISSPRVCTRMEIRLWVATTTFTIRRIQTAKNFHYSSRQDCMRNGRTRFKWPSLIVSVPKQHTHLPQQREESRTKTRDNCIHNTRTSSPHGIDSAHA